MNPTHSKLLADCDAIEALREKATCGPWEWRRYDRDFRNKVDGVFQMDSMKICGFNHDRSHAAEEANAEFIAAAHRMADLIEKLRDAVRQEPETITLQELRDFLSRAKLHGKNRLYLIKDSELTVQHITGRQEPPTKVKRAYYETHEPPHCPTCDCGQTAQEPGAGQPVAWRCFHCGKVCSNEVEARRHFGNLPDAVSACVAKLAVAAPPDSTGQPVATFEEWEAAAASPPVAQELDFVTCKTCGGSGDREYMLAGDLGSELASCDKCGGTGAILSPVTVAPQEAGAGEPHHWLIRSPASTPMTRSFCDIRFLKQDADDCARDNGVVAEPFYAHPPASTPSVLGEVKRLIEAINEADGRTDCDCSPKRETHSVTCWKFDLLATATLAAAPQPQSATPLPAAQSAWMPIESAPRGEFVLVFNGKWRGVAKQDEVHIGDWWGEDDSAVVPLPTHWQPLPAPPATPERQG